MAISISGFLVRLALAVGHLSQADSHQHDLAIGVGLIVIGAALAAIQWIIRRQRRAHWLDTPLLRWNARDHATIRQLGEHFLWIGATGSGKSSSSVTLMDRIVALKPISMVVMGAKPEDLPRFLAMARRHRRKVRVFGPGHPLRFNFMEYLGRHAGDARTMTKCLMVAAEGLMSGEKGGDWRFWEQNNERVLLYTITALLLAYQRVTLSDIQKFIQEHATSRADLASDAWTQGFQNETLKLAYENAKTPAQRTDLEQTIRFWLSEWPAIPDKTRGSILTGVLTILSVFNSGELHQLFGTTSNFSIDEAFAGALIYVDASPTTYGQVGVVCSTTMKYLVQWSILRQRTPKRVVVLWIDEFQQFVNSFDPDFLAQARSYLGAMVCLTQGTQALIAKLKDEHQAKALLGAFNHRIVHSVASYEDAEWAADLIGRRKQLFYGGSTAPPTSLLDEFLGNHSRFTGSFNEQMEYIVDPRVFMNGLRRGGEVNGLIVDAIVSRTGQAFSTGENHLFVTFKQRK